jgi:hypothetical protein
MPTLPLYTPGAAPDASHRVLAPGGYEQWSFVAEDAATATRLVAAFSVGFPFHPGYLRAFARYRRRPTRFTPPVPTDYATLSIAVDSRDRFVHPSTTHFAPNTVHAATDRLDVRIGLSHCRAGDDGIIKLLLNGPAGASPLSAELEFTPILPHAPVERFLPGRAGAHANAHAWVIANPLCNVAGTLRAGAGNTTLAFRGRGYHDHHYGTAPVCPELSRLLRGTALFSDRAYTFQLTRPRGAPAHAPGTAPAIDTGTGHAQLLRADASGVRDVTDAPVRVDWSRRAGWFLPYPSELRFGTELRLTAPAVLDASPFSLRIQYTAAAPATAETATAFCELAYPNRLRRPVLGRIIEQSIQRVE